MAYLSSTKDEVYLGGLGCGPTCSCGPCQSGSSKLSEWYEKEEDEPERPASQRLSGLNEWYEKEEDEPADQPQPPVKRPRPGPAGLSGWGRYGFGNVPSSFRGLSQAPATPRPNPLVRSSSTPAARGSNGGPTSDRSVSPEIVRRTNQIFNARHPELRGRAIRPGESQLIAEWRSIRNGLLRGDANSRPNGSHSPAATPSTTPLPSLPRLDPFNKLADVHPELARRIRQMAADLGSRGVNLTITRSGGRRTFQEQDELYAQGRTRPGNIVTNSRGGLSNHNYGLAVDVVPFVNGRPNWNVPATVWQTIGDAGKRAGLSWGGDWRSLKDPPHFELPVGMTVQECLRIHQQGGLSAVWAEANRRLQRGGFPLK